MCVFNTYINVSLTIMNITYNYMPNPEQLLFTMSQQPIISIDNISGITANIGTGKSHLCELFASYWLNSELSKYSLVCYNNQNICLYIDTERSHNNCYHGLLRIEKHTQMNRDAIMSKLIYESLLLEDTIPKKLQRINQILSQNPNIKFVIIDGILDLVRNPNDLTEASDLGTLLVTLAVKYHIAILYTLHGNRNDPSGKGKGHIGDVLQRKSESFLQLKIDSKNPHQRILTSEFQNGKVRNGSPIISAFFRWNTEKSLFQEYPNSSLQVVQEVSPFQTIFQKHTSLLYKELIKEYKDLTKYADSTTHRHIKEATANGILTKTYNSYSLNT